MDHDGLVLDHTKTMSDLSARTTALEREMRDMKNDTADIKRRAFWTLLGSWGGLAFMVLQSLMSAHRVSP